MSLKASHVTRILVLPLYPQYAAATTASVNDAVMAWMKVQRRQPELRLINHFHDDAGYIDALAQRVRSALDGKRSRRAPVAELSRCPGALIAPG